LLNHQVECRLAEGHSGAGLGAQEARRAECRLAVAVVIVVAEIAVARAAEIAVVLVAEIAVDSVAEIEVARVASILLRS